MPKPGGDEGKLYFGVDARHVRQLGRELVADRVTALSELVKNSYDADATQVQLSFIKSARPGGVIQVVDNGVGMTLSDVRERWMRISTDFKERSSKSDVYSRDRVGRKGIGRFAAESLGQRLILTSASQGGTSQIRVVFDWAAYEKPGVDLSSIPNSYEVDSVERDMHGTVLRIENVHDAWSTDDIARVRRNLLLLQAPFAVAQSGATTAGEDPGFDIKVDVDGVEAVSSDPGLDEFFDAATAVIEGEVDQYGNAQWRVTAERLELSDETEPPRVLLVGPTRFRALYFIYRKDAVGSLPLRQIRTMANAYSGVRVYRDGMRIPPYGEAGNDWLGFDSEYRRRTILFPIGNLNWFGEVRVSREDNPLLIDTASREGVVENEAFKELQRFVREGLLWGAQRVAASRQRKETTKKSQQPESRAELLDETWTSLREAVGLAERGRTTEARRLLDGTMASLASRARQADERESAVREELLGELELLRVLASLGTSIAVFGHEVRAVLNLARGAIVDIDDEIVNLDLGNEIGLRETVAAADQGLERLDDLATYIETYVSHSRRREKEAQPLHEVLRHFKGTFDAALNRRGIHVDFDVEPPHLRTPPMSRSELEAVLFNLLTNAVKAMDVEGHSDRRIQVSVTAESESTILRFQDTGQGIDETIRDRMFEPFITTTMPGDSELGFGTGLGLKIVADIVSSYDGTISIGKPDAPFSTAIEIRFRLNGVE